MQRRERQDKKKQEDDRLNHSHGNTHTECKWSKYSIQQLEILRLNEKARSNYMHYKKHMHFKYKDTNWLNMKEKKRYAIYHQIQKSGMAILSSYQIDSNLKKKEEDKGKIMLLHNNEGINSSRGHKNSKHICA